MNLSNVSALRCHFVIIAGLMMIVTACSGTPKAEINRMDSAETLMDDAPDSASYHPELAIADCGIADSLRARQIWHSLVLQTYGMEQVGRKR